MKRTQKEDFISQLKKNIEGRNFVLSAFQGLTVADMEDLRGKLRNVSCKTKVVKNRLLSIALNDLGIEGLGDHLSGTTLLIVQDDNSSFDGIKVISEFAKENEKLLIKAGRIEGANVEINDIKKIASLPAKEVLVAKLLSNLVAPISRFVCSLNNINAQFVYVLSAIKDKKENENNYTEDI